MLGLEVLGFEVLNLELPNLEDLCFAASALLGTGLRLIAKTLVEEGALGAVLFAVAVARLIAKALLEEGALGAVLVAVAVEADALALGGVAAAAAIVAAVAVREVVAINEFNEPDSTAAYRVAPSDHRSVRASPTPSRSRSGAT